MNLYNEGNSYLGQTGEVTLPKLGRKFENWRGGGMNGNVKVDFGLSDDAIEMTWKLGGIDPLVLKQFGAKTIGALGLRFAGSYQKMIQAKKPRSKSSFVVDMKRSILEMPKQVMTLKRQLKPFGHTTNFLSTVRLLLKLTSLVAKKSSMVSICLKSIATTLVYKFPSLCSFRMSRGFLYIFGANT